jgi:hypothetical protein
MSFICKTALLRRPMSSRRYRSSFESCHCVTVYGLSTYEKTALRAVFSFQAQAGKQIDKGRVVKGSHQKLAHVNLNPFKFC